MDYWVKALQAFTDHVNVVQPMQLPAATSADGVWLGCWPVLRDWLGLLNLTGTGKLATGANDVAVVPGIPRTTAQLLAALRLSASDGALVSSESSSRCAVDIPIDVVCNTMKGY